jgi:AraC family transcriptional regulator, activator of mtrCDE
MLSKIDGQDERLEMLCGRFLIGRPHDRLIRDYLPTHLVVRATHGQKDEELLSASNHLMSLMGLMRVESDSGRPGGYAILNALTAALFTLTLRAATECAQAPTGLLALAAHPRLLPAVSAMFHDPAHAWSLTELANLCNMSRATFTRHCHDTLGRTAIDLLLDIRMSLAANEFRKPMMTAEIVAESVGYQSVAAFRRAFTEKIGMTPGKWRHQVHGGRTS